jgi:hypothetical protein
MTTTPVSSEQSTRLPEHFGKLSVPLMLGGLICIVVAMLITVFRSDLGTNVTNKEVVSGVKYFFYSYLTSFSCLLAISIGGLFFVLVQHLVRAGWSASLRRLAEIIASMLPAWFLLFLPILATLWIGEGSTVYEWAGPKLKEHGIITPAKEAYLNVPFFSARAVFYVLFLSAAALLYFRMSRKQDESKDPRSTEFRQKIAGPAIIGFALVVSFIAFDWIMSLSSAWFSTAFGVYIFAGAMQSFFATMVLFLFILQKFGRLKKQVTPEHFHDLGKFMFGFTLFWAYIAFSQYMLIWYANLPEETFWFDIRQNQGWAYVSIALILLHFAVPLLGTMSRHVRRNPSFLCFWACWILVMHFVDYYWLVMPTLGLSVMPNLTDLLCLLGMIAMYVGLLLRIAAPVPLVAQGDPRLPEALAFHNI